MNYLWRKSLPPNIPSTTSRQRDEQRAILGYTKQKRPISNPDDETVIYDRAGDQPSILHRAHATNAL